MPSIATGGGIDPATIDLTDLDAFAHGFPHPTFAFLRTTHPVWWHAPTPRTPGGEGFWVVSTYDACLAAARDATTFSSQGGGRRDGGGTLIEDLPSGFAAGVLLNMMDDPRHQQIRRLFAPALSPRVLAAMEADLRERARRIVTEAVARREVDFLVDVAAELPLQAIARLLGVPQEDRHRLFAWANATLDYDDHDLGEIGAKQQEASAEMFAYGSWLIERRRAEPADDLLSLVANGEIEGDATHPSGRLDDLEAQMFFNLLIAAGSETTRNSIAIGTLALIERPEAWAALQADRALLPNAIEEMLRWASSTTYNRRTATADATLDGVAIAAGDKVTLWWGSANYDERAFPDPFRFDIRRSPNRHLAFGHGSHFCLGAGLARVEMRVVLDELLDQATAVESTGPVEWVRSNKHTGLRHMPVRLLPRATGNAAGVAR
jgi:cytochrome P450